MLPTLPIGIAIKPLDTFEPITQNQQIPNGQSAKIEVNDTGVFYYEQNNVAATITVNDIADSYYKTIDYQGIKAANGILITTANFAPHLFVIADGERIRFMCMDRGGFLTPAILESEAEKLESLTVQANQSILYATLIKIADVG